MFVGIAGFGPEALVSLCRRARESGTMTVLDIMNPGGENLLARLEEALPYVDVFLPNDDEARALTGEDDPARQAEALMRCGPGMVVITMGADGVLLKTKDVTLRAGVYPVEFVDASGSGDAFDAGFIAGMLGGWDLERTLKFACAMGASCVRRLGCTDGLFTRDEAEEFIRNNEIRLETVSAG